MSAVLDHIGNAAGITLLSTITKRLQPAAADQITTFASGGVSVVI